MEDLLKRKPNLQSPLQFQWMSEWDYVTQTDLDSSARELLKKQADERNHTNLEYIAQHNCAKHLLAFLRYDFKKILIRTRFNYIDRLADKKNSNNQTRVIEDTDLGNGYFEPILLCFPVLELIGRMRYPCLFNPDKKQFRTSDILELILKDMGNGYKDNAQSLVKFHRHALSHEFRPDGVWRYDLNTEGGYGPPKKLEGKQIYLNIPHFIDSSIMEIEKVCRDLASKKKDDVMKLFCDYARNRFKKKNGCSS